jgi:hypothetical protein
MHNAKCWQLRAAALATAMIFLNACERVGSDSRPGACPSVLNYPRIEQIRVAKEIAALPERALIVEWLADYAILREQVRSCV